MEKEKKKIEEAKTPKDIFKSLFSKEEKGKLSSSDMRKIEKLKETRSKKVERLLELSRFLEEFQLELKNLSEKDQMLELPFIKSEIVKRVKMDIVCAIFENKNEILGINLKKEPTFMRIYKLEKNFWEKLVPIRTLALDLTEGLDLDIHFLDPINSETQHCLQYKNNLLHEGKSNTIRWGD